MPDAAHTRLVRMAFTTAEHTPSFFHIGGDRKGLDHISPVIHSDTLFSALCHAWVDCYGAADLRNTVLQPTRDTPHDPPLCLSSAFLYDTTTLRFFLPKPLLPPPGHANASVEVRRIAVRYASQFRRMTSVELTPDLLRWLTGEEWDTASAYENFYLHLLQAQRDWAALWVPHWPHANAVSRDWGHTNTFARGVARLSDKAGYYFLLAYSAQAMATGLPDRLHDVLGTLAELGIGGERSLGLGRWRYEPEEHGTLPVDWVRLLQLPPQRGVSYLLSLYAPTTTELHHLTTVRAQGSAYQLVPRKGWFDSPTGIQMKRQSCRMLGEGSLVSLPAGTTPRGALLDVSPAPWRALHDRFSDQWHPIYRSGLAFAVQL